MFPVKTINEKGFYTLHLSTTHPLPSKQFSAKQNQRHHNTVVFFFVFHVLANTVTSAFLFFFPPCEQSSFAMKTALSFSQVSHILHVVVNSPFEPQSFVAMTGPLLPHELSVFRLHLSLRGI